ncbi:phosphopantetheine-binding protein [Paenibacillus sp. MMS18-CY102]|uniref:phosphopantetheine-binding protein n=1 Tax=Paenibacillus sp. MMS18-CY102 TaxID=2682849 RepID=UPI001365DFA2|nr:phosphopantetheine-binding protein [Paenibacillus sp. MMS18-CY102]
MTPQFFEIISQYLEKADEIDPEEELVSLGLDSLKVINLVLDLEDAFGIEFPDRYLNEETFRTSISLWNTITAIKDNQ